MELKNETQRFELLQGKLGIRILKMFNVKTENGTL